MIPCLAKMRPLFLLLGEALDSHRGGSTGLHQILMMV
jgi:hypothetical protein